MLSGRIGIILILLLLQFKFRRLLKYPIPSMLAIFLELMFIIFTCLILLQVVSNWSEVLKQVGITVFKYVLKLESGMLTYCPLAKNTKENNSKVKKYLFKISCFKFIF